MNPPDVWGALIRMCCVALLGCLLVSPLMAQGPRLAWSAEDASESEARTRPVPGICTGCSAVSKPGTGTAVKRGALIGFGVGLVGGALIYAFCSDNEAVNRGSCTGKAAVYLGATTALGAAIGLLVGASDPPAADSAASAR